MAYNDHSGTVFDSLATQPSSNQKLIAESPSSTRMARAENAHILESHPGIRHSSMKELSSLAIRSWSSACNWTLGSQLLGQVQPNTNVTYTSIDINRRTENTEFRFQKPKTGI